MRVGGFSIVLAVLLTTLARGEGIAADSPPWFGEFLVRFPDPLLLEREPSAFQPPASPQPAPAPQQPDVGMAQVSSLVETAASSQPLPSDGHCRPASEQLPCPPPKSPPQRVIFSEGPQYAACENWQILPDGILYPSYIAGEKEPRMAAVLLNEKDRGAVLEETIGGRLGLLRYGTLGPINPQGWQWDLESAAMLRQDIEEELDVEATDFRIGSVLTWKRGPTAIKAGFYHLSAHVGDEFLERNPNFQRINYSRDVILFGVRRLVTDELTLYGEVGVSVRNDGGSEPLELQFGAEYTSCNATDPCGAPFAAINYHAREEFDFGGGLNILAGWEWRGPTSDRRLRIGGQFYSGKEIQWSFFDEDVTFTGAGIWYDF